ncbi:hypothetical protein Trco_004384 [Trichoderma cornu-damae]|uniref:Serine/threonine-protein phosphatase n=1 Tax=Trichoderma cornu-damae TaxID=654480 RepID=A0A9P8QMV7_9HYPO|nr:hypothetical protein Trco_004384 [Trichoderma cornu-damae]
MTVNVPRPGPANLGPNAGLDEWLEEAKQCHYLPERAMKELCERVKEILMEESNIQPVCTPVTVCGDIHGQFYDLLELFRVAGGMPGEANVQAPKSAAAVITSEDIEPPTEITNPKLRKKLKAPGRGAGSGDVDEDEDGNGDEEEQQGGGTAPAVGAVTSSQSAETRFVFLGDYVDRGYFSLEAFTLLMCLKAKYPDRIVLVRGNHESRQITQVYGFYEECQQKYGNASVWKACCHVFDFLVLAAIVDGELLCVHGGLSPEIRTIDQIRVVARAQEIPHEGAFCDLVWSDPDDIDTWAVSPRGAGWLFGDKVATEFNHYHFDENSVVTVWSAPNYCYRCGNVASIMTVDNDLAPKFSIFSAVPDDMRHVPASRRSPGDYFLKPKPPRQLNPITAATQSWIATHLPPTEPAGEDPRNENLASSAPKRFAIYEPLALLPTGSFTGETWTSVLQACGEAARLSLWKSILKEISKTGQGSVTHLAVNEGIPLRKDGEDVENVQRSPSGLRILFGDFGPAKGVGEQQPTKGDFDEAFWVRTKQNGILQTWAPRWTMFSRGNVKEKARLLGLKRPSARGEERKGGERLAVDLYAGIGYFAFSYAALGMRVLCWEINPWSVEGLRRGAEANKWSVKVVQGEDLAQPMERLLAGGERIVVLLESNERAPGRVAEAQERGLALSVEHVNCGFLPTSAPAWKGAWEMTRLAPEAWLHLHENVGVEAIEARRGSIQEAFEAWAAEGGNLRTPSVEHVEQVKTFAPGVWHCVFDVRISGGR